MKKLIRLSEDHYIIVDDSEINEDSYCCNLAHRLMVKPADLEWARSNRDNLKVITHSTMPLKEFAQLTISDMAITPIQLSDVQELTKDSTQDTWDIEIKDGVISLSFKEQLKAIIPRIHVMMEKEQDHLDWLIESNAPKEMVENSREWLRHYRQRHEEYTNYANKL